MRNIGFLVLAIVLFGLAYYVYWIVAQENAAAGDLQSATRGVRRPGGGGETGIKQMLREWQPYLSVASSVGGIASFLFQVRVWMRSKS